jgi:hypothetical protein
VTPRHELLAGKAAAVLVTAVASRCSDACGQAKEAGPEYGPVRRDARRRVHRPHRPDRADRGQRHGDANREQRASDNRGQGASEAVGHDHRGAGAERPEDLRVSGTSLDQAGDGLPADHQRGDAGDQRERGQRDPVRLDDTLRLRLGDGSDVVKSRGRLPKLAIDLALDRCGTPSAVVELQPEPGDAAARSGAQQLPAERRGEQQ